MCPLRQVDRLKSDRLLRHTGGFESIEKEALQLRKRLVSQISSRHVLDLRRDLDRDFQIAQHPPANVRCRFELLFKSVLLRPHHTLLEAFAELLDRVASSEKINPHAHLGKSSSVASSPRLLRAAIRSRRLAFSSRFSK